MVITRTRKPDEFEHYSSPIPEPKKNLIFLDCKTWTRKKSKSWNSIKSILKYWKSGQKLMHFGEILVRFFCQSRKLENPTSFWPIFSNSKNPNLKNFQILKPEKPKLQHKRGSKTRTERILNSIKLYWIWKLKKSKVM